MLNLVGCNLELLSLLIFVFYHCVCVCVCVCVSPVSSINCSYTITVSLNRGLDKRKVAGLNI
jgi:hypothetical protein